MDSASFLALNEKLHYADIKSNSLSVDMPRTSLEEEPVFHYKTKDKKGSIHECLLGSVDNHRAAMIAATRLRFAA